MIGRVVRAMCACIVLGAPLGGCSLIGLGTGALIDAHHRGGPPQKKLHSVLEGDPVTLVMRDGRRIRGIYVGVEPTAPDEYATAYERWRATWPPAEMPPPLGASLTCRLRSTQPAETSVRGQLEGFDIKHMAVREVGGAKATKLAFSVIAWVADSSGTPTLWLEGVRRHSGEIPSLTSIAIRMGAAAERFRMDQVARVETRTPRTGKIVGLVVGLVLDATTIAIAVAVASSGMGLY